MTTDIIMASLKALIHANCLKTIAWVLPHNYVAIHIVAIHIYLHTTMYMYI